ncbi:MAG: hypothetical protein Tsb002_01850 [Wenzhouxiangellaceae bacterium]
MSTWGLLFQCMSFVSATPDMLARFRLRLGDASLSSWQRESHILWATEFIDNFSGRTLESINNHDVERFLSRMESEHQLDRGKREDIIASLRFLYQEMDGSEPPWLKIVAAPERQRREEQFAGLSRSTLRTILPLIEYQYQLPVALIYGAGLKASECCNLRVADIQLGQQRITVHNTAGAITHQTILPGILHKALRDHLDQRRQLHLRDNTQNFAGAPIPSGLSQDGAPYARSWRCQFIFAEGQLSRVSDGSMVRRQIDPRRIERAVRMAADRVELGESVTAKSLRLSFARHLIQEHIPPAVLQYVLGQNRELPADLQPAFEQLHSPLDQLWPAGSGPWR